LLVSQTVSKTKCWFTWLVAEKISVNLLRSQKVKYFLIQMYSTTTTDWLSTVMLCMPKPASKLFPSFCFQSITYLNHLMAILVHFKLFILKTNQGNIYHCHIWMASQVQKVQIISLSSLLRRHLLIVENLITYII
jgi:hypothetical protein